MPDFGLRPLPQYILGFSHPQFSHPQFDPNMAIKNCTGGYFWIADRIWNPGVGPDPKILWSSLSTHFLILFYFKNVKYGQKNVFFALMTDLEFVLMAGISAGSSLGWMPTFCKNRIQIGGAEFGGSKKNFQMLLAIPYCGQIFNSGLIF